MATVLPHGDKKYYHIGCLSSGSTQNVVAMQIHVSRMYDCVTPISREHVQCAPVLAHVDRVYNHIICLPLWSVMNVMAMIIHCRNENKSHHIIYLPLGSVMNVSAMIIHCRNENKSHHIIYLPLGSVVNVSAMIIHCGNVYPCDTNPKGVSLTTNHPVHSLGLPGKNYE